MIQPKKIEVIALGRGDTGTAVQYLILKNYALKYHPDLIVQLFFTANDIKNNSPVLQHDPYLPYFVKDTDGSLHLTQPAKRQNRSQAWVKDLLKNLKIVKLALSLRQKYETRKQNKLFDYPRDYDVYNPNYDKDYQDAWDITQRLILATNKQTVDANAKYILITLANNEQVNTGIWDSIKTTYPKMKDISFDLDKPDQLLKNLCDREQLTCFFMADYFRSYLQNHPSETTHFRFDGHLNETGTNLLSDYLFEALRPFLIK